MAAFPGGATKSFGNDLPKMCGAGSFFMQQQFVHVVARLAKSAAQATSPGVDARLSLPPYSKGQRHVLFHRCCK